VAAPAPVATDIRLRVASGQPFKKTGQQQSPRKRPRKGTPHRAADDFDYVSDDSAPLTPPASAPQRSKGRKRTRGQGWSKVMP
jgi:hypothetical protein